MNGRIEYGFCCPESRRRKVLKTKKLTIKVLPSDKAAIERLAQAEGEPVAVVVRRLIREAARSRREGEPTPAPEDAAREEIAR
jgi:hypothetical protein